MSDAHREAARRLSASAIEKGFELTALHAYTDMEGRPIYWRIRAKHPVTREKWIRPMRLNGDDYELAEPKFTGGKPIYFLHRIARNPEPVVWIIPDMESDPEAVILTVALRDRATFEMRIPKSKYDGFLLLDLVHKHFGTVQ